MYKPLVYYQNMDFNGNCHSDGMDTLGTTTTTPTDGHTHTLSIEIKTTDEIIILPDPSTTAFDFLQYNKRVDTPRNIIFAYNSLQKGKMYHHRNQTIIFHKFKPLDGSVTWIT
jgi:hypothetical protein